MILICEGCQQNYEELDEDILKALDAKTGDKGFCYSCSRVIYDNANKIYVRSK